MTKFKSKSIKVYTLLFLLLSSCNQQPKQQSNVDAWYKNLFIYNLDVKTFKDSDGNGEGDFNGLTEKLPYLKQLGINTIWLAPFQPSPLKDDGYDVVDYYGIDGNLGTQQNFKNFMAKAKSMGFYVIMDIALNHTSNEHPWFKSSRQDSMSPKRNWYLWSKLRPKDWDKGMGFPVVEKETWRYDSMGQAYYFHRFYNFQPDLNYQNEAVITEAERIMKYWLDQGMDGFRLDAVPFIIDDPRQSAEKPKFDFKLLNRLASFVKKYKPNALLLGEANVEPDENKQYFGDDNGLDMMFNFYANQYLFYGLASGDVDLFKDALNETKAKPPKAQWAWFLRNHDEIDLGRLSKPKLNEVYEKMGSDSSMQLYERGIRRRLATMLGGNQNQLRLAYSLLYSLPGTPVIRQGEEIGMGDDLRLKERLAVRTPMQWDTTLNGGFSKSKTTFRPVINTGMYGYKKLNVVAQKEDPKSLLNFINQMIGLRKRCAEINNGDWQMPDVGTDKILAMQYNDKGRRLLICHNFSDKPQTAAIKLPKNIHAVSALTNRKSAVKVQGELKIKLSGYGFEWYRLK